MKPCIGGLERLMAGSKRRQTEAEAFEGAGGSDGHFRPHPHPCLHQSLPWNPCTETQPSAQAFLSLCSASREGAPLERKHTTRHMKQAAQKVPSRFLMKYLHIVAFVEPRIIGRDREFGPGISAKLEKGAHCTSSSTTPHRRYTIGAQVKVQPARDRRAGGRPSMQSLT